MEIINGLNGEYILISFDIVPPSALYYKDTNLLKTELIDYSFLEKIFNKLSINDTYSSFILDNKNDIKEVVITKDGIYKFSLRS